MQARYYDPVLGRFLSPDPVGFAQGGVRYFNRYGYTANDPVNATDPTGMCSSSRGALVDCPRVVPDDGGFAMQGAEFNGMQTNLIWADSMGTMNEVVGTLDQVTATDAGQSILVDAQINNGITEQNFIANSGVSSDIVSGTHVNNPNFTFMNNVEGKSTSFVDSGSLSIVEVLGATTQTGHAMSSGVDAATFAEKIIHEAVHGSNPGASEAATQGLANVIHRERGSRLIRH
jgi:uncharacterized protein RhaS with RHS repeats